MIRFEYDESKVHSPYHVLGIVYMKNGCCKDNPVLITVNNFHGKANYSCQCGCGMWCTTGHPTPVGALRDYQTMSNRNVPMEDDYHNESQEYRDDDWGEFDLLKEWYGEEGNK